MSTITVNVDEYPEERMENHPEIDWSEVTRQTIREKIETLEVMANSRVRASLPPATSRNSPTG